MARLEDQVTPQELLEAIRGGALKHDLAKKYRASEKDLAMMLHPLYRRGELSKEEFNDFFRGIPLQRLGADERLPEDLDDPPTQFLETLKDEPEASPVKDEEPAAPKAVQVEMQEVRVGGAEPAAEAERDTGQAEGAHLEAANSEGEESPGRILRLLEQVFVRLEAIENRLAFIERKLSS